MLRILFSILLLASFASAQTTELTKFQKYFLPKTLPYKLPEKEVFAKYGTKDSLPQRWITKYLNPLAIKLDSAKQILTDTFTLVEYYPLAQIENSTNFKSFLMLVVYCPCGCHADVYQINFSPTGKLLDTYNLGVSDSYEEANSIYNSSSSFTIKSDWSIVVDIVGNQKTKKLFYQTQSSRKIDSIKTMYESITGSFIDKISGAEYIISQNKNIFSVSYNANTNAKTKAQNLIITETDKKTYIVVQFKGSDKKYRLDYSADKTKIICTNPDKTTQTFEMINE